MATTTDGMESKTLVSAFHRAVFDLLDDDDDDDHTQLLDEWNKMTYQFDTLHRSMAEEEQEQEPRLDQDHGDVVEEKESILPQRLSQLSTRSDDDSEPSSDGKRRRASTMDTSEIAVKKVRLNVEHSPEQPRMPTYLSTHPLINCDNIDDERQRLAFCLHQIATLPIEEELWTGYLHCGTGLWRKSSIPIDRYYWPHHVKSLMPATTNAGDEQRACEDCVNQRLRDIRQQLARYQTDYEDNQRTMMPATLALEEAVRDLVREQATVPLRMKVDMALAVLRCDDEDHSLQDQYKTEKPTDYQIQMAKSLHETTVQLECAKCELVECRQRLLCNRPPASYDRLQVALPLPTRMAHLQRYEQLVQDTKTRLMAMYLAGIEARLVQYRTRLREQTHQMWQQHRQHVPHREMSPTFAYLIDQRASVVKKKLGLVNQFTIDYHIRSAYGRLENIRKGKETDRRRIGFLSSLVLDGRVDTLHRLTDEQRQLLRRGPTYVSPCQMYLLPSLASTDELLRKQYAPLKHQLALLFCRYNIDIARQENMKDAIKKVFKECFSHAIMPDAILQRASHEKQRTRSIRTTLKNNDWILRRTADQQNTFYLGRRQPFEEKCTEFMTQTDRYQLLFTVDENSRDTVRQALARKVQGLNVELEALYKQKRLTKSVYETLRVNADKVALPYLYFLPELSAERQLVGVAPMVSAHHSATSRIARYLHRLLRPLIARPMYGRVFSDEADFIQKLIQYSQVEQQLRPTSLFATIEITNAQSMVSHAALLENFTYYLTDQLATNKLQYTSMISPHPQHIAINTMTKLAELFLQYTVFHYQGKIYGFRKGGPNSLLLTDDLLDAYAFIWQQRVFEDVRLKTELCGRHRHSLFLTWNQSESELRLFLDSLAERYPTIQIRTSMGRNVPFLNTHIENRQGHLYTHVAHASNIHRYTLPFVVGNAKEEHARWFQAALLRAGRVCSHVSDFVDERIHLEMAYLFAGYSIDFLDRHLRHFFQLTNTETIRFSMPQTAYENLRRRLLNFAEQQRTCLQAYQALEDKERVLHLHYLHEYGSRTRFHQHFHQIWTSYLKDDPHLSNEKTKIILHTKHVYSLNALLAEQKPSVALLNFPRA